MRILADTNTFLAVALDEPERSWIIESTSGRDLAAPEVLPFEVGNALTAMVKRGALRGGQVAPVWRAVQAIPVELHRVDVPAALEIATKFGIYAYDAYFLECALRLRVPLLTLDRAMQRVAKGLNITVMEQQP